MESPKTGIILLALVAITTASGAFLGWTLRPPAVLIEKANPLAETPVAAPCLNCQGETPARLTVPAE